MVRSLEFLGDSDPINSILNGDTIEGTTKEAKKKILEKKKKDLVEHGIKDLLTYYAKLGDPDDKAAMKEFIIENFSMQEYTDIHDDLLGLNPTDNDEIIDMQDKRIKYLEEIEKTRKQNIEQSEFLKSLLSLGDVDPKLLESVAGIPENQVLLEEIKALKKDWESEKNPAKKNEKKKIFMNKKRELKTKVSERFSAVREKLHDVLFRNYTYDSDDFNEIDLVNKRKGTVDILGGGSVELKYSSESRQARRRLNRVIEELNKIDSDHPEDGVNFVFKKVWMKHKEGKRQHYLPRPISGKLTPFVIKTFSKKDRDTFEKKYEAAVENYLDWIGIDKITESDADEIIQQVRDKFDAIREAYKEKVIKLI